MGLARLLLFNLAKAGRTSLSQLHMNSPLEVYHPPWGYRVFSRQSASGRSVFRVEHKFYPMPNPVELTAIMQYMEGGGKTP